MEKDLMIQLQYDDIYAFHMRNIYTGTTGKFCITLALVGMGVGGYNLAKGNVTSGIVYIAVAVLLLLSLIQMLRKYAKKNIAKNVLLEKPLHYRFTDEGLALIFDEIPEEERPQGVFPWSQVAMIKVIGEMMVLYVDAQKVHLFPFRELGEHKDEIVAAIKMRVPANRIKGRL